VRIPGAAQPARSPKKNTDSFKENNTMSTGSSFNPQHDVGNRWFIEVFWNNVATTVEPEG
jgi:hypothetical protein